MTSPSQQKAKETLDECEREWKAGLKLNMKTKQNKIKIMASGPTTS